MPRILASLAALAGAYGLGLIQGHTWGVEDALAKVDRLLRMNETKEAR